MATTLSNRLKNMSIAGMLLYILFEKIMIIIDIDQANLQFRWCAKVLLYSYGGKTALKNHARLNFVYKNRRSQKEELGVTDRRWCASRQLTRRSMEMEVVRRHERN